MADQKLDQGMNQGRNLKEGGETGNDHGYYPLASVDSDGNKLVSMFVVTDLKMMQGEISLYLSEITPQHFRLHSRKPITQKSTDSLEIRCPRCGKPMKQISANTDAHNLSLYRCNGCDNKEEVCLHDTITKLIVSYVFAKGHRMTCPEFLYF